jgi:hypothetical protein
MRRELFSSDVCTQTQSFEFRMYLSYAVTHDPSERPSASNLAPYFGVKKYSESLTHSLKKYKPIKEGAR